MKRVLTLLIAVGATTPANAQDNPSGPVSAPFEVVRLGDSSLTCEALVAEIGSLNQQLQAAQQQMMAASEDITREAMQASRGDPAGGLAIGLGSVAAGFIPGGRLVMGAVQAARQQAAVSSMQTRQEAMQRRMQTLSDSTVNMAPISQRVAHLSEIARDRSC